MITFTTSGGLKQILPGDWWKAVFFKLGLKVYFGKLPGAQD